MKTRASYLCIAMVASLALAGCPAATTSGTKSGKPATALETVAKAAADSGMSKESLIFAERLYKEKPNDPEYIVNYAKGLRRAGNIEAAKLVIRTPAKGKRATPDMMTEAAMVLVANGEYDEATGLAQKALEKAPKSPDAHHALALAMSGMEEFAGAQLQFQKALDLWPDGRDQTPIINNRAMSMAAQGKIEDARMIMSMATGEALTSRAYQNNRALLDSLEGKEIKVEKLPGDKGTKANIKIQKPGDAAKGKPGKPGKMQPIVEYRGINLDKDFVLAAR